MLFGTGLVFEVSGEEEATIGEEFHSRVAAVRGAFGMAVQELDPVVAPFSRLEICIRPHPGHEVPAGGAADCLIPKSENVSTIGEADSYVAVTRQAPGRVDRFAPSLSLVF